MGRNKKFNETSRVLTVRVPTSRYNEIKSVVENLIEIPTIIDLAKKINTIRKDTPNFGNMQKTQDDLWILYRLKFGKGTRIKINELLPKFTQTFNKNLN